MRLVHASATAVTLALALSTLVGAQGAQAPQEEAFRTIPNGGIAAPGWTGNPDVTQAGAKITDGKFAAEGGGFHVMTGPAANYWNPANKASGDYTVSAKFDEPKFQNLNDHAHPYGVFIGGNKMGTPNQSLLYCAAYGTGRFIVRGFGPAAFAIGRPVVNAAVHVAPGLGQPVDQTIAMSVKGDSVSCTINGTEVWKGAKADVVTAGKLDSLDGVFGIRAAHNTEFMVTGFGKK